MQEQDKIELMNQKGFAPLIVIVISTLVIGAGVGGFLIFRGEKELSSQSAAPQFIQSDFIDLSRISSISKFRSGSGHDFSKGSGETCRSMKHYFNVPRPEWIGQLISKNNGVAPEPDGKTDISIYSPVSGKIISIEPDQFGEQIYIRPDFNTNFTIRLFHIYPPSDIKKGVKVKAGQKIGVIGQYQNTDIAITKGWTNYVSYFEVMPDNIFSKYQALGVKSRQELIISKEERDASPLECNGEWFANYYDSDPNSGNFVYLNNQAVTIEPTPFPTPSTQPLTPKIQPELKPKSVPPTSPPKTIIEENKPPVLKNLGVNIQPWDKTRHTAGDFLFENKNYVDNKIFTEFAHKIVNEFGEKLLPEIGFNVPVGTKVVSPIDGVITDIKLYEPSQDYIIFMKTVESSPWIVGFEHIYNMRVKAGDRVVTDQELAEVSPSYGKTEFGNVEIKVWTAGKNIIKYCPFKFLDDLLKPVYEEKINRLAKDWEEFIGKDVYKQENWVAPGCLLDKIIEH